MNLLKSVRGPWWATAALASVFLWAGCGGDGTGVEVEQTGVTLQGQIVQVGNQANQDAGGSSAGSSGSDLQFSLAPVGGVIVTVGIQSSETDGDGRFTITNMPLGSSTAMFSGQGINAPYNWTGVEQNTILQMNGVQVENGSVTTDHTGIWVGTAGSTAQGSQGPIAFTLIIAANGNALSGNASVAPPDNSIWTMTGTETGTSVKGEMLFVSSDSPCATGADFTGTFYADTLRGDFTEVNPPTGCGLAESGVFIVVKQ